MPDDLPAPLTPPDCDLRDFPFMPLECLRLHRSKAWLAARKNPALGFYMVNMWTTAWHEVPAASLEDDDDVLAHAAMCDPKAWPKVKEQVMRGWIKCSDGRLYHAVVAEKARDAWERKQAQRQRTEAARQAKRQKMQHASDGPVTGSVTDNATDDVTASKGQGQGQGQGEENKPLTPSASDGGLSQSSIVGRRGLRANGTNPRALAAAAEAAKPPPPEPSGPVYAIIRRDRHDAAEFYRAWLARCAIDAPAKRIVAPSAFVAARIKAECAACLDPEGWRVEAAA